MPEPRKPVGSGRELATGVVAAFVIALAAIVVFWLISRAGRGRQAQHRGAEDRGGDTDAADHGVAAAGAVGRPGAEDETPRGRASIV